MPLVRSALLVVLQATLCLIVGGARAQAPAPETPASAALSTPASQEQVPSAAQPPHHLAPQPAPEPASSSSHAEAQNVQVRLRYLHQRMLEAEETRERQGIARPMTLTIAGAVVGTFFGVGALAVGFGLSDIKRDIERGTYDDVNDSDGDGVVDHQDLRSDRKLTAVYATVAGVHLGLAAFGAWWLTKRVNTRRRLDRELGGLEAEWRALQLKLDVSASAHGALGQLTGTF